MAAEEVAMKIKSLLRVADELTERRNGVPLHAVALKSSPKSDENIANR